MGPLIHIGFHKTATTLLQERLFTQSGVGFYLPSGGRRAIHDGFINCVGLELPPSEVIEKLRDEHETALQNSMNLVLSHERLSGYPASGGFDQGLIADRLHAAFPNARILIFIREQRQMIYSMYLQGISDGSALHIKRFLSHPEPKLLRKPGFDFSYYEYDRLISKYQTLFGRENVKVIAFEAFRADVDSYARSIIEFAFGSSHTNRYTTGMLSAPINQARPLAAQAIRRQFNRIIRNQLNENGIFSVKTSQVEYAMEKLLPVLKVLRPLDPLLNQKLKSIIHNSCAGKYTSSNLRTEQLISLPLSSLGYDVP